MSDEFEPTFRRPTQEDKNKADPLADYKAYFAYWEARRIERQREERRNSRGLSVYEQARGYGGKDDER